MHRIQIIYAISFVYMTMMICGLYRAWSAIFVYNLDVFVDG